jgi:hypothetical protein
MMMMMMLMVMLMGRLGDVLGREVVDLIDLEKKKKPISKWVFEKEKEKCKRLRFT